MTKPVAARYLIPDMPTADELLPWLLRIDQNRWYTNFGPLVLAFEAALRTMIAARHETDPAALHLTTLGSGHHALELGLRSFDLPVRAPVLMPAVTFPSCPLAALGAGLTPVLADVDSDSWTLTPAIARQIVSHTHIAAVMPVAVYGVPLPAAAWDAFAAETGVKVIIDAAAALEVQAIPRRALVAHSLHATKPFGVGEGGVLIGHDADAIARVRQWSAFGLDQNRIAQQRGTNTKLSEYHAAVGLAQHARWMRVKERRGRTLAAYRVALQTLPVTLQPGLEHAVPSLLMARGKMPYREDLLPQLQARGIGAHRSYLPPLYRHPAFADLHLFDGQGRRVTAGGMMVSEDLLARLIGLPFHSLMDDDAIGATVAQFAALL